MSHLLHCLLIAVVKKKRERERNLFSNSSIYVECRKWTASCEFSSPLAYERNRNNWPGFYPKQKQSYCKNPIYSQTPGLSLIFGTDCAPLTRFLCLVCWCHVLVCSWKDHNRADRKYFNSNNTLVFGWGLQVLERCEQPSTDLIHGRDE